MDKNAIKKFAVWARRELLQRVKMRAAMYGVTDEGAKDPENSDVVNGERVLSNEEVKLRKALLRRVEDRGYERVMEEAAYTWFNRFAALRFMEVNGYLPGHLRVFSDNEGNFKPQIMTEAIHLELDGLDKTRVYDLKTASKDEELFKYLLVTMCNALAPVLPGMFQRVEDWSMLLLPDNLLREGNVPERMVSLIPEEDWRDQVQIIGWLYQYYNTEPKDAVFAALKKNVKVTKENIPAATQLFTPDWIVRYMAENSLGRLWLEGHPNDALRSGWRYYIDEAEQAPKVQAQLDAIRAARAALKPEDLRCIDPCCGSGHILCYLFDLLVQIYEAYGVPAREAAAAIVQRNLWGLDIDARAAQLAYFAVMMKARQYDRRFLSRNIQPHVYVIEEGNAIDPASMQGMGLDLAPEERAEAEAQALRLIEEARDATEYGSLIELTPCDWGLLRRFAAPGDPQLPLDGEASPALRLRRLVDMGEALAQKYHAVVTNPPYMGASNMNEVLAKFVKDHYPDSKSDLSTAFMEKTLSMCLEHGYMAMINIPVWMFLSSYEKLRNILLKDTTYINMVHPGRGVFGSDFGTTAFVLAKQQTPGYRGSYRRLFDKQGEVESNEVREGQFLSGKGNFVANQSNFSKIPGAPVAYWVSEKLYEAFKIGKLLEDIAHPRKGLATTDNNRFLRLWYEVASESIGIGFASAITAQDSQRKWFPLNKGGEYRKWYGNKEYLVNWANDGAEMKAVIIQRYNGGSYTKEIRSEGRYFQDSITWSALTAGNSSFRYSDYGALFDSAGSSMFPEKNAYFVLGCLNSKISVAIFEIINPTLNYGAGTVANMPIVFPSYGIEDIEDKVKECVTLSRADWDSFETSWDFQRHPLVRYAQDQNLMRVSDSFKLWHAECEDRFAKLKANEEELNRIFIDIYGLGAELSPEVEDKDVTVRRADPAREARSLISYAVGCMLGRYSLDAPGLAWAGGDWDPAKYKTFPLDPDNAIPILEDDYRDDDVTGRFVKFVETVWGEPTLEENLRFIADALGGRGAPREAIRRYFLNNFYADHLKTYQKRPIYWLLDSGKRNAFKCLFYMHRYKPDLLAQIRTDYIHGIQSRYYSAIEELERRLNGAATSERVKLTKQLAAAREQEAELRGYEEKVHHLADKMIAMDLDDGVKHNYALLADVLAKVY